MHWIPSHPFRAVFPLLVALVLAGALVPAAAAAQESKSCRITDLRCLRDAAKEAVLGGGEEGETEASSAGRPASSYDCEMPGGEPCSVSATNYEDVTLLVDSVTIGSGKMRWHLSFWNQGSQNASMAMGGSRRSEDSNSYVVDDQGNQYKVRAMIPDNYLSRNIPAGVRTKGIIEFDAPEPEAEIFTLYLKRWTFGYHQLVLPEPTVSVKLNAAGASPPALSVVSDAGRRSGGRYDCTLPIAAECTVQATNYPDVTFYVDSVTTANGRMQWHVSFWNQGSRNASMAMGGARRSEDSKSYLIDDRGNQYTIRAMTPENYLSQRIPAGARTRGVLHFDVPDPEAEVLTLYLKRWTFGSHQLVLPEPTVAVKLP